MNTKNIGSIIETKFLYECLKLNYTVSQPYGDNSPYDFILDNGEKLIKVQCKSFSKRNDVYHGNSHRKTGHRRKIKISYNGLCDYMFFYNIEDNVYAFVPIEKCNSTVFSARKKNIGRNHKKSNFIEDYQII
jgi:hypothetical protein